MNFLKSLFSKKPKTRAERRREEKREAYEASHPQYNRKHPYGNREKRRDDARRKRRGY